MQYNRPYLEKYRGRESRHECPQCKDKQSFALYLDGNTAQPIHPSVGRCNHESGCTYHYTPKDYFSDNPCLPRSKRKRVVVNVPKKIEPIGEIPSGIVERLTGANSTFIDFLLSIFDEQTVKRAISRYVIGCTKKREVVFWQIDTRGRARTGKIMKYDVVTGKRIKDFSGINWVHSKMKKNGVLPVRYNLQQCLFGEHLLALCKDKVVALVESEKTAVIASCEYPKYLWLATGGKSQLSFDKLKILKGRTVILFPDTDGFEEWTLKADEIRRIGCKVVVSNALNDHASDSERRNKIDIADWIISEMRVKGNSP